jgi:hypothetical protein
VTTNSLIRIAGLVGFVFVAALLLPAYFPADRDFVEYYSAARLLAHHGNPYDGEQMLEIQREIRPHLADQPALSLWTPPWTMPLYLPLGFFSPSVAHLLWILWQTAMLAWAVEMLWATFNETVPNWVLPYFLLVIFAPVFWNLHFGQNTAFLVLGLAGFVYHKQRQQHYHAGLFVALTALKPHVLVLVGLWLLCNALTRSGRKSLLTGIAVLVACSLVTLLFRPTIFSDYLAALRAPATANTITLSDWEVPLVGYYLRRAINVDAFWIQFMPCLLASVAGVIYYARRWRNWNWTEELPRAVLFSALSAPYGGWIFDLTILLVVVLALARTCLHLSPFIGRLLLLGLMLACLCGFRIILLRDYWYVTPAIAGIWLVTLLAQQLTTPERSGVTP